MSTIVKVCRGCKKEIPLSLLVNNNNLSYGKAKICYPCRKKENARYYPRKNRAKEREYKNLIRFSGRKEAVVLRDGGRCLGCGMTREDHFKIYGKDITVDHIDRNKTNNDPKNLQTLCLSCHSKKDSPLHFKGRKFCKHGHPLMGDNVVLVSERGRISKRCMACRMIRNFNNPSVKFHHKKTIIKFNSHISKWRKVSHE